MAGEEFLAMDSDAFGPYADEECQDCPMADGQHSFNCQTSWS